MPENEGRGAMTLSRRTLLKGAGTLPLLAANFPMPALAQSGSAASAAPPILFVHGNGDQAAFWITTLWRMESNGVARDRMLAINFTTRSRAATMRWRSRTGPRPKI